MKSHTCHLKRSETNKEVFVAWDLIESPEDTNKPLYETFSHENSVEIMDTWCECQEIWQIMQRSFVRPFYWVSLLKTKGLSLTYCYLRVAPVWRTQNHLGRWPSVFPPGRNVLHMRGQRRRRNRSTRWLVLRTEEKWQEIRQVMANLLGKWYHTWICCHWNHNKFSKK